MVGDWTYELQNDRIRYYSQITLDKKGNYRETEKMAHPHIDEAGTTTWEVEYNETSSCCSAPPSWPDRPLTNGAKRNPRSI